jgi:hypothetical protein
MINTATIAVNQHIETLKSQLGQLASCQLDYLIIAHPDNHMIGQIKSAFQNKTFAILTLPQDCWAMEDEEVAGLADWAVNDLGVGGLLLVGHSQGGTPTHYVEVCPAAAESGASTNRIGSLVDRVKANEQCVRETEKHFIHELECLRTTPAIESRLLRDAKLVQGLFYRSESGTFCVYDGNTKSFQALLKNC